ncbi:MAG: glycosyltransferase family 1 protein [Deferrisomatales bacterium]|nr:glycosyltransferase family 1 protein [Deferrisomatales bacterium]
MRIGLNLVRFVPGDMGGMETYFRNLLGHLQQLDQANDYWLLCDERYAGSFELQNSSFRLKPWNYTRPSWRWFARGVLRNALGVDILRPAFNRLELDLVHHPFSFLNPTGTRIPSVLTFHDAQHEFFPEFFSPFDLRQRRQFYRRSAEEATRIIAISAHVKADLVERYGISPDKIDVVHNGCSPAYRIIADAAALETLRRRCGLDRPFLYYPAATWPHKNHQTLLAALKLLRERHGFDGQLVLTGIAKQSQGAIEAEIARLGLSDAVRILGYLPYEDLPGLYNLARLLVFPSRFEGFGIPLVEAMASGCPVACSSATSIPEVVGEAGLFFDPDSAEEMAEKVWRLWTDEGLRGDLRARGLRRAGLFGLDSMAQGTLRVYEKAAGRAHDD